MKPIPKLIMATSLLAMSLPAYSSALWQTLIPNTLNFYEDQSRESIFDIDGSGSATVGDVFIGFIRLDDRSIPTGDPVLPPDELYGVFSIQIAEITPTVGATGTTYDIDYTATTVAGLTLADLGVTNTDATSLTAIYEDVNQNLLASPGDVDGDGQLTIIDFVKEITNDTLDVVAGLEITTGFDANGVCIDGPNYATCDHFRTDAEVLNAPFDPIANLDLLNAATLAGGLPGATIGFHAGLGITYTDGPYGPDCTTDPKCFARVVEENSEFPFPPSSLHEAVIENGDISGAADLWFDFNGTDVNPFFSGTVAYTSGGQDFIVGGAGTYLGYNFHGLSNNADVGVFPVPEPATLALMGLGLFGLGAARRRRKV